MSPDITQLLAKGSVLAIDEATVLSLAFTLVVTLFAMRLVLKTLGQDRSILENGIAARARILSVRQTGLMLNHQPQVEFQLKVHPPAGRPYYAQTRAVIALFSIPRLQPGVEVPVKIHPMNLTKIALVPHVQGASMEALVN